MGPIPLSIKVSRRQILRRLGYPKGREPAPQVVGRVERGVALAAGLIQPAGLLRIVETQEAEAAGIEARSPLVGLGLVTLGPALEAEQARRDSQDDLLDALVLDAYGSAAAEAAADALNFRLCNRARDLGHHAGARSSPGYGSWDMQCQAPLLELIGASELGVSLTDSMLMIPRKSVSFAARLRPGRGPSEVSRARRCARCAMTDCAFREEEEEP